MEPLVAPNVPVGLAEAESIRLKVRADGRVDDTEKQQIRDLLDSGRVKKGVVPALKLLLDDQLGTTGQLHIRGVTLPAVREVSVPLEQAKQVTADNGLDEVYFTDDEGKLFVAFQEKGPLNDIKEGHRGQYGKQQVTVVHADDEINSAKEGATAPFHLAKSTVQTLATTGVSTGVTAAVTAAFLGIGNTVVALRSAQTVGEVSLKTAAKAGATTAGATIATAGVVMAIGTALVLGGFAVKGAISGARVRGDFSTLDTITK